MLGDEAEVAIAEPHVQVSGTVPVLGAALPRGVVLERVRVEGDRLIAGFGVDGAILSDPSTRVPGDCAQR